MVVVPEFLIKRIYQKGSLKKLDDGASVVLKNVLPNTTVVGIPAKPTKKN